MHREFEQIGLACILGKQSVPLYVVLRCQTRDLQNRPCPHASGKEGKTRAKVEYRQSQRQSRAGFLQKKTEVLTHPSSQSSRAGSLLCCCAHQPDTRWPADPSPQEGIPPSREA